MSISMYTEFALYPKWLILRNSVELRQKHSRMSVKYKVQMENITAIEKGEGGEARKREREIKNIKERKKRDSYRDYKIFPY